jgi:lysozyme
MSARKTAITCASAACLAMAVPAVKQYEGYWPTAKVDTIGTGEPCTGGYGSTEGVKCGERHTEKEWSDKLQKHLKDDYDAKIGECIHVELPDGVRAAALSAAYNAGSAAVCRSPMVAKWNAGDIRGGCESLLTSYVRPSDGARIYTGWYIRAQGRVVPGLINRRAKERKMCLAGINPAPVVVARVEPPKPAPAQAPKPSFWSRLWHWIFK